MEPSLNPAITDAALQSEPPRSNRWQRKVDKIFLGVVVVPTLLSSVYFGLIASDVYISESHFVIRNPQRAAQSGIGAILQSTGFTRSQDDTYSVHDFIRSRDALRELDQKLNARAAFGVHGIDYFNRFPGPIGDSSFEAFHSYYQSHVTIAYDAMSSITELTVRAYSPQDARNINDLLLQMGERLVNNLNIRSRQDLIQVAEQEVRLAETKSRSAASALSAFRSSSNLFDPTAEGALQLQGVGKLQDQLLATEAQLSQLRLLSPTNPQIPSLASQVEGLRKTIASESAKVTGRGGSFSSKSPDYDRLILEKGFSDRQLASALTALDTARSEAARKQLYLERLVQPNLPDKAVEPRRIRSVATVFIVGLIAWGVLNLIVASIREHTE